MLSAETSQTLDVTEEHDGSRLDHFITAVLPDHSRSQIQRLIRSGSILLNSKQVRASHAVHAGDLVDLRIPTAKSTGSE